MGCIQQVADEVAHVILPTTPESDRVGSANGPCFFFDQLEEELAVVSCTRSDISG